MYFALNIIGITSYYNRCSVFKGIFFSCCIKEIEPFIFEKRFKKCFLFQSLTSADKGCIFWGGGGWRGDGGEKMCM